MRRLPASLAVVSALASLALGGCFLALGFGDYDKSDPEQIRDAGGSDVAIGEGGAGSAFFTIAPTDVVLVPGTTAKIEAKLQRRDGFLGVVRLSATGLPPGVTTNANGLVIAATASTAEITITAAPEAKHTKATLELRAETDGKTFDAKITLLVRGAPGSVDTSFGTDGVMHVSFAEAATLARMRLLADDRILLAGDVGGSAFALARLGADGALDPSFAGTGTTFTKGTNGSAAGLGLGPTGFVAAGAATGSLTVVRYRDDGSLDPAFNAGMPLNVSIATFSIADVFVKPGGGIAITGDDGFRPTVLHIGAAGAGIDTTVGDAGVVQSAAGGVVGGAALSADGTLFAGASFTAGGACSLLDFGAFGATTPVPSEEVPGCAKVMDLLLGDGGTRAVAGTTIGPQFSDNMIAYRRSLDEKTKTSVALGKGVASGVALDSSNRMVVVGSPEATDGRRFFVTRIGANDALDPSFALGPASLGSAMVAKRVAIQRDGRIVVAGTSESLGKRSVFTVVRYWP